jgi:hypothetical protein
MRIRSRVVRVVMRFVHTTGKTWYKMLYQHNMYVINLSNISIKTNFKQITRIEIRNLLHTYCVGTTFCIRSCLLCEQTASQLVAIATRSDTGSYNRLDLIQHVVPPHYVCNGYLSYYRHSHTHGMKYTNNTNNIS